MEWDFGGKPSRGGISLTWYVEWAEWLSASYSWRNFTVAQLGFEHSPYKDSWEINIALFGVCACFTRWWRGAFLEEIEPMIEDIESGRAEREGRIRPFVLESAQAADAVGRRSDAEGQ